MTKPARFLSLVTALAVVTGSSPAVAAPGTGSGDTTPEVDEAKRLRAEAEQHFFRGDFDAAIAAFESARELAPHTSDLFNIGRIHEEKGDMPAALHFYEQFAKQPRLSLEERATAAERIDVLRVLVEKDRGGRDAEPSGADSTTAASQRDGAQGRADNPEPRDERPVRAMITAGSALIGVGIATAAGGGVGFGLAARRSSDRVADLSDGSNPSRLTLAEAEELEARGKDFAALQITFLVAGGALAVVGAGLLAGGLVKRKRSRAVAVAPSAGARVVGFNVVGRF